jgi:hypothetical protein
VDTDTPPPAVTLADARALYPTARPDTVRKATEEDATRVAALRQIVAQMDELSERADRLRGQIAEAMGEAGTLEMGGVKLCTFKAPKPRRVTDWKAAFAAVRPELEPSHAERAVAEATAETPSARRFLLCAERKGAAK